MTNRTDPDRTVQQRRTRIVRAAVATALGAISLGADTNAATFTYAPTSGTTDLWSAGTNWSAAPVSDPTTELTFVGNNATALTNFTNTNTDDLSSLFQLNILDLQGTGPAATGAATININSASPSTGLNLLSNGATTPIVNLNANNGAQAIIYNVNAPITLSNDTLFTGNGSGVFNFSGGIGGSGVTLSKSGTSTLRLNGTSSIGSLNLTAGGLAIAASSTSSIASGTLIVSGVASIGAAGAGTLSVGTSSNSGDTFGTLDLTNATSVTMNVNTINVGWTVNSGANASGTIKLGTTSNVTAASSVNIGNSGGARNGDNNYFIQFLTTAGGAGVNTISTPTFNVDANKSTALVTVGAGNTLAVTGVSGGRAAMNVGGQTGGGGGGNYLGVVDASAGAFTGNLTSLGLGVVTDGSSSSNNTGIVTLGASSANHLDISGTGGAAAGGNGLISVGRQDNNNTGTAVGVLTINNLDATSSLNNTTTNGNAILVAGNSTGNKIVKGTLNLNGGSLTVTTAGTSGAAIAGGTLGASNSNVNFNGMRLIAGSSSTNWIRNITNARVGAGGAVFDTGSNSVTLSQPLVHSSVGTVTGITITNSGSYTIGNTGNFAASAPMITLVEPGNAAGFGLVEPAITGTAVTNLKILAAENFTTAPSVTFTGGTIPSGGVAASASVTFTPAAAVDGGLTKLGGGTLTLAGTNTYNGATNVSAGALNLTGSVAGDVNVASGAAIAGQGTVGGALNFSGASTLAVMPTGTFLTAATVNAASATVLISPLATLSSTPQVILNAPGGITGTIGTNFVLQSRANLTENGNTQLLIAASGSNVITWTGSLSNAWDVQGTKNWTNLGASDLFFNADNVNFDDSAATFTVAIAPGGVAPASVTFTNLTHDYTLGGGAIGNGASVTFNGSRTVTLTSNNTYTGGTTINSGTVQLGDGVNPGGSVQGNINNNGALAINYGANNGSLNNNISGAGSVNINGTGSITVSGSNTYSGTTSIAAGTVVIPVGAALGTGSVGNSGAIVTTGSTTLVNNIGGTGSFTHIAGTVVLTGNNTYTGGTTISPGATLSVGNGGTIGSLSGAILDSGTLIINRSDNVTVAATISGSGTLSKRGAGIATLSSNPAVHNTEIGNSTDGGTVAFAPNTTAVLGDGTGFLNVGFSGAANGTAALDVSSAASFTASFDTINVGVTANSNGVSTAKMKLPASSTIIAASSFLVGDSGGARNQQDDGSAIQLTTADGGITTVRTPIFSVGRSKTSAKLTLGAGSTFDLAGAGVTPRTFMGVGNGQGGGGGGTYNQTANFSGGVFTANLSGLVIADGNDNTLGNTWVVTSVMTLSNNPLNHLDVSGPAVGLTPANSGVVVVARQSETKDAGLYQGTLTIGNLDASSAITVTDGLGGIGSGNAILVGGAAATAPFPPAFAIGDLDLNGGTLTITTTGAAIAGSTGGGASTVNFNGMTLRAGASSTAWIQNISGAFIEEGGLKIDTGGFAVAVPQQLQHANSDPDGGITKLGAGTLTLTGNNNYSGATTIAGGAVVVNNASQNVIFNNGGANVQAGELIFDYTGNGTVAPTVKPLLVTSFNNNGFKNTAEKIRSSTADAHHGLGYLDDAANSRFIVAYTFYGDANLDLTVNMLDFNAVATNFGQSGMEWSAGDFNYDGTVNSLDFTALANNFNQSIATPALGLGTLVPEPASIAVLATFGLFARRRRNVARVFNPCRGARSAQ